MSVTLPYAERMPLAPPGLRSLSGMHKESDNCLWRKQFGHSERSVKRDPPGQKMPKPMSPAVFFRYLWRIGVSIEWKVNSHLEGWLDEGTTRKSQATEEPGRTPGCPA